MAKRKYSVSIENKNLMQKHAGQIKNLERRLNRLENLKAVRDRIKNNYAKQKDNN